MMVPSPFFLVVDPGRDSHAWDEALCSVVECQRADEEEVFWQGVCGQQGHD